MSGRFWTTNARLIQRTTCAIGVALLALVVWSVTRPKPPSPTPITGSWLGAGTVYDSTGGGSNQVATFLRLSQASDGGVSGSATECNDQGQTASFSVSGVMQGGVLVLNFSGVTLRGRRKGETYPLTGSVNGTSIVLTLRSGNASDFTAACDALYHVEATLVP